MAIKMKPIKFDCHGHSAPAYSCNEPGDNSGWYVQADVANDMQELLYCISKAVDMSQVRRILIQAGYRE